MTDRQLQVYADWDSKQRERIKALITEELIAEHAAKPLGQHSDALERVLQYFRRQPQAGKYIIVATKPWEEYRIGVFSGQRGQLASNPRRREAYATEEAAMHGIFLRRVARPRGDPEMADLRNATIHGYADRLSSRRARRSSSRSAARSRAVPGGRRPPHPRRHEPGRPGVQGGGLGRRRERRVSMAASSRRTPARVSWSRTVGRLRSRGPFTLHAFVIRRRREGRPGDHGTLRDRARTRGYALCVEEGGPTLLANGETRGLDGRALPPGVLVLRRGELRPDSGRRVSTPSPSSTRSTACSRRSCRVSGAARHEPTVDGPAADAGRRSRSPGSHVRPGVLGRLPFQRQDRPRRRFGAARCPVEELDALTAGDALPADGLSPPGTSPTGSGPTASRRPRGRRAARTASTARASTSRRAA